MKVSPIQAAAFIKRHCPLARDWPRAALVGWVCWAMAHRYLGIIVGPAGIVGAGIARPVAALPGDDFYAHDPAGPGVFIDLCVGEDGAMRELWHLTFERFGRERQWIAWQRAARGGRIVTSGYAQMLRRLV